MMWKTHSYKVLLLLSAWLAVGCSTYIDDDLSDCPPDNPPTPPTPTEDNYELNYELRLVTNITTEINTQLNTTTDASVANALRAHLQNIFTDYAHDVDLSFYDTENEQAVLYHEAPVMNASQKSYTIYLPVREYMHLAVANLKDNKVVELRGSERCPTSQLLTTPVGKDTIDSHATGLFTARQPISVLEGVDQTFHVKLYMANCASALVIDPRGHSFKDLKVYTTGFASDFLVNDSVYTFSEFPPIVRTSKVETGSDALCYCSVNLPSKTEEDMRTVIETEFDGDESDKTFWEFRCYLTKEDGTVTESILTVKEPLHAGQFKIIKAFIGSDSGDVRTNDQTVGVSVTLDWNDAGHHEIDL